MRSKITVWKRLLKSDWKHNHYEYGWVFQNKPNPKNPKFKAQVNWEKGTWRKKHGYIENNCIAYNN